VEDTDGDRKLLHRGVVIRLSYHDVHLCLKLTWESEVKGTINTVVLRHLFRSLALNRLTVVCPR